MELRHTPPLLVFLLSLVPTLTLGSPSPENPFGSSARDPETLQRELMATRKQAEAAAEPLLREYVGGTTENDLSRATRYYYANLSRCGVGTYRYASPTLFGGLPSDNGKPLPVYYFHIAKILGSKQNKCIVVDGFVNESGQSVIQKCLIPEDDLRAFNKTEAIATALGRDHYDYFNKVVADNCQGFVDGQQVNL